MISEKTHRRNVARKYGGTYPEILLDLFNQKKHPADIAMEFNLKESSVYYHLKKLGVQLVEKRAMRLSEEKICAIFLEKGINAHIAKKFEVGHSTVGEIRRCTVRYRAVLEKHGLIEKEKKQPGKMIKCIGPCGKMFERTPTNWAVCPDCDKKNKNMNLDMTIYYQNQP